ncbi:MAG: cation diffusion facilitator family transporter [Clostridia bacterium]|nr:cation diffusion facilitator family transporter [Clostridia bacterium]
MNLALALGKLFVGLSANSLCILLDSTNGFFDTLTGVVAAVAFGFVALAPTERFPYGFGRSEYLAGFVVAVAAAVMGFTFFMESLNRLAMPEPVWYGLQSTVLLAVSIVVKFYFSLAVTLCNKKICSKALRAISLDGFLDVGITTATLVSFTLSARLSYAIDAFFGIAISIVVFVFSVKMIVDTVRTLIGTNETKEEKNALAALCEKESAIDALNDVRLHDYGYRAKFGVAYVTFSSGSTEEEKACAVDRIATRLKEETGATVEIVPYKNTTE